MNITTGKLDRLIHAFKEQDKLAVYKLIHSMSGSDMDEVGDILTAIREIREELVTASIISPTRRERTEFEILVADEKDEDMLIPEEELNAEENFISKEEKKSFAERYGYRANAPKEDFIQYHGIDQLYELVMEDKKKKGWKFKGEE
ncbi:hypothetical protein CN978_25055 [Priestia megaterium]|uniref:hypothetical protein n=1 Tax=Priestia megaterium TaxID=1404 RepID=UPI000BFDBD98|nr:hypothetical protein [Priestia megaterium]PGN62202.1 hypothetical protein CN978_25055 [Priestia megaterium]